MSIRLVPEVKAALRELAEGVKKNDRRIGCANPFLG
jgi:hypothetical protein